MKRALLVISWVVCGLLTWGALHLVHWFPVAGTSGARNVDRIFAGLLIIASVIFGIVAGTVIVAVIRFRARAGHTTAKRVNSIRSLEVLWTVLPLITVAALGVVSAIVLHKQDTVPASARGKTLHVRVHGQQFAWTFDYPDQHVVGATQLELPVGRQVAFTIDSRDVIHSFWVPQARVKADAVPGQETKLTWRPIRRGTWVVECSELCGAGHSYMHARVRIVTAGTFDSWARHERDGHPTDRGAGRL